MQWYGLVFFATLAIFFIIIQEIHAEKSLHIKQRILEFGTPVMEFFSLPVQNFGNMVTDFRFMLDVHEENKRLREEIADLRSVNAEMANLTAENQVFRRILNLREDDTESYITARVISDSSTRFYRSLLLNAGRDEGVREDMPVIAGHGLIGRVVNSGQNYSRVLLLNDLSSRIPALIEGTDIRAILAGRNGAPPQLIHLLGDFTVPPQNNMRVVTSGYGGIFPPGIAIGRLQISQNQSDDPEAPSHYSIIPYADPDMQTFLQIHITTAGVLP